MESGKLKSYTLAFKKRVLIRLEENNNNISKTAKEFNIHRKNVQRWIQQKDVISKAVKDSYLMSKVSLAIKIKIS